MKPYSIKINSGVSAALLQGGIFVVILGAKSIPPHIGMMINGEYCSLTIKGPEQNVSAGVLLKNITLRRIPSVFVQIIDHPVFSRDYLLELLQGCVSEHQRVEANGVTCLGPVKQFFKEGYQLRTAGIDFLFHLLPTLEENGLVENTLGAFLEEDGALGEFVFPLYSKNEIDERILKVRDEIRNYVQAGRK